MHKATVTVLREVSQTQNDKCHTCFRLQNLDVNQSLCEGPEGRIDTTWEKGGDEQAKGIEDAD